MESNSPKSLCASISVDKDRPYDPAPCDGPNSVFSVRVALVYPAPSPPSIGNSTPLMKSD